MAARQCKRSGVVVTLFGGMPAVPGQPDKAVVAKLRELLELAERGGISAITYAYVGAGGNIVSGWTGSAFKHEIIASVALLHHQVMNTASDRD